MENKNITETIVPVTHGPIEVIKITRNKWLAKTIITAPVKMEFEIGGATEEEARQRINDFLNGKPV